ncbi:type 1 glutamine amidotransferase [Streptomyces sp. MJP52]|uniref:type 1 glutamine amidotransferase n=1 Tax=Streptomyces sp. MJP52 TaxID=2940555 RepID=UPI002475FCD6|nr:type 1 glutamine amidotransferase [Streptomyces sp. MJP52]MDH6223414.1 GMP synthase (glutamine-hydrolyzing) [Streptomyces sp. MJP52]
MTAPTALVIQNFPGGGPRRWGDWLDEADLGCEVVEAHTGAALPDAPAAGRHAALVVLGGPFMPDDDVRAPWLPAVRALTRRALDTGLPYFGICLGGQLLAQVAGGEVRAGHGAPEAGSTPLTLLPGAVAGDPLLHGLPGRVTAVEHHVDAVTALPPAAHWLARSRTCPYQAFRVGPAAWGVQFHPETGAEDLVHWNPGRLARNGFDHAELLARARQDEAAAAEVWRTVAHRFAAVATGRAGAGA